MKLAEKIIYWIVILGLGFALVKCPRDSVKIETVPGDTVYTTVTVDSLVPHDTTIYDVDTLYLAGDSVFIHDTIKVYNDYFKMYSYKVDTLISEVNVSINSQITQNRLYKQDISILNNRETKIISDPNNLIGIGGIIGLNNFITPMVSYQFNKHEIGVGYNFVSNKTVLFTYQYKFKLK